MNFRFRAPSVDFWVDVRLREFSGRWLAVAEIAGEPEIGLGRTARGALAMSLSSLGETAAAALLADSALLGASREVGLSQGDP